MEALTHAFVTSLRLPLWDKGLGQTCELIDTMHFTTFSSISMECESQINLMSGTRF